MKPLKKIVFVSLLTAMALVLSYVESLLPPLTFLVPGVKMGLANIVIVFALCRLGIKEAVTVSLLRVGLSSLLFGNAAVFAYSMAGAVLSLVTMIVLMKLRLFSTVGISVAGAVMHNVGQILMAIFLFDSPEIGYYLIVLTITGTVSGIFIGLLGALLVNKTKFLKWKQEKK